ncbi:transcriptional regulator, IclR family [Planococcus glaciei]|uniref:IclR family transcriptional regulator n=1 Tax=Planococcus glaciei TaxID=459472 RepID=UPI000882BC53|nr:IclR family transcriptional regulator [Planococcus glaciei]SDH48265.1 transcriptional regulator, IclR family [Planococcus glaciei]
MAERKPATIQSLQNGLDVLELIARERRPMKFTEILLLSNMTKSNIHKYLTTLAQAGFLNRDPVANTYRLGNRLIEIGNMAQSETSIAEIADPYMKNFTEQTGLTALIALPSIDGPFIKEIWSVTYGIDIGAQNGTTLPLFSSTGYIFYAFQEGLQLNHWIDQSRRAMPIEAESVDNQEIAQVKEQQFAAKNEPLIEHISSCSVPVFNHQKQLVAAITAVGYKNLIPQDHQHEIAQQMLDLAQQLSHYFK